MYTTYFGLAEPPFNITPDPRFVFPSQRYREALSALLYGIRERKGFILLTGEVGSGKTTICRKLVHDMQKEDVKIALILNPGLSELELLKAINDEFGIPSYHNTKKGLLDELNDFLLAENRKNTNVVLIIDESQTLPPALLEQIRMLSNLETENDKLVQIILIGQPELNDTLALPQLEQLNQRIGVRYHILPLTYEESIDYIKYRLQVAKAKIDIKFTEDALRKMYTATHGIPRRINVVCDRALLGCYATGTYVIDGSIMGRAISEIGGEKRIVRSRSAARLSLPDMSPLKERARKVFSGYSLTLVFILLIGVLAVAFAVGGAIYMASVKEKQDTQLTERRALDNLAVGSNPLQLLIDSETTDSSEVKQEKKKIEVPTTPTPTPDEYKARLASSANWVYEGRDIPLVRVNDPQLSLLACKLSMLKMWGYHVDMDVLSKMNTTDLEKRDLIENETFRYIPVEGTLRQVLQYNLPLIVKIMLTDKDKATLRSEYVVMLKADGKQIVIGDPLWGVSTTTFDDLNEKWGGATAMYVDIEQLSSLQRGDRNERVKALQIFLRDQYGLPASKVSGVFDVDTYEAIKKLQSFYKLKDTGNLDPLTLMIINSRIMRDGPRLNNAVGW